MVCSRGEHDYLANSHIYKTKVSIQNKKTALSNACSYRILNIYVFAKRNALLLIFFGLHHLWSLFIHSVEEIK
jgi:hypothetical protein